jgi:hypothetical protein
MTVIAARAGRDGDLAFAPARSRVDYLLASALAAVTVVVAAATFFLDGVLRGPAVMQGSARGTALVMLLAGAPALIAAMVLARRGHDLAVPAWLGVDGYLVYNAVMLLFATPFNRLFLGYEAILGLGIAGVITLLRSVDVARIAARLSTAPARIVAGYLWVIAVGNALVWLKIVVPGLGASGSPSFLDGTGLTTNPLYVQDLAFWLPLAGVAGWWLWQRRTQGYLIAGALLVMWLLEAIGVTADQWFGSHADPASTVATMGGARLFVVVAGVDVAALVLFYRPAAARRR